MVVVQTRALALLPISVLVTMLLLVRFILFRVKPTPENWKMDNTLWIR